MEADIAVQILTQNKTFVEENVEIKTLIGDEDSCTIANLRRASDHAIDKWTDINHATRKISKLLYAVKKIPKAAIEYLIYCFNSALRGNDGNVELTKAAILNIVPHAFGEHDACGLWCNYASDPEGFKHKYLPGGKPLTGDELKASITPIFKQAADNAEKLAPRGSSQINENCNAVITTKATKAKHYSDSSSSDFRVAAGISQVNLGTSYLNTVNTKLGLSPMKANSLLFRKNRDERRKKRNALIKTKEFKKKRRALFRNRQKSNASAEAREGITYQSNSEISASLELNEKFISSNALTVDGSTKLVIFDIETTGLKLTDQIVQIAAQCHDKKYNAYIMPSCNFSAETSKITGLTVMYDQLHKNAVHIQTVSPKRAITELIAFFKSISSTVVLAAHNGLRFDVPRILIFVQQVNLLEKFQCIVIGFTDTLNFLKKHLNERRN
ncbi:uncharacterized protein LOC123261620 [Cotesia glomerata]|uniref:uncharacterized protein LOC123261620 n=1 Tax=Cotesia glomerata TaxID=32391 RepID=UPI001D010210|nr:uncharacterized protein LOC123261620 [Cotesia glomerata]